MTDTGLHIAFHESRPDGPAAELAARVSSVVPELETNRLRLRAPEIDDFQLYAEIMSSDRGRFIMARPVSRADIWIDFCGTVATWLLRGHGIWSATLKKNSEPVGFVLIGAEPGDEAHELGFAVSQRVEGQGIAFEAAVAARDWAWSVLQVPRLVSYVDPENTRSAALARRLGASRSDDRDKETQVFDYPRPEGVAA